MPKEEITLESLKAVIDSQNKAMIEMKKEMNDMHFNLKKLIHHAFRTQEMPFYTFPGTIGKTEK